MVVPFGDGVSSHLAAPLRRGFFGRLPLPKLNRSRYPNAAAQTRIVSKARIQLDSGKSVRSFKAIICVDISEFESYMPSHAVGLSQVRIPQSICTEWR